MSARARVLRSLTIACAAVWLSGTAARVAASQPAAPIGTIHTVALPGGVEGIRAAIGDVRTTPAATVLIEMTRRFHGGTSGAADEDPVLARLRRWLRACLRADDCGAPQLGADRVPLPGSPALWRDVVFGGRVPEARLVPAILDRRDTALLYTALLSMREDVRAWILERPALLRQLHGPDAGALLVVAPYLALDEDGWQLPGGRAAAPIWRALAGSPAAAPEASLLALLGSENGLLAYLAEVVATLAEEQQRAVLALADPDAGRRIAAGRELLDGVRTATRGWDVRQRPFWRPSVDPAFLLAQMRLDEAGRPRLPGGRLFWTLIFGDGPLAPRPDAASAAWADQTPVSVGFLLPRIWLVAPAEQAIRYEQVLFASRRLAGAGAEQAVDVATVVRGYPRFPQLLRVLDRLEVDDVARLAALVRRAEALRAAATEWRGHAAVVRWQSALVFLDYMLRLGAIDRDELTRALDVLARSQEAAAPSPSRGTRIRALLAALGAGAMSGDPPARAVEDALVARLTRSRLAADRRVTWEDQAYRFDIGAAERDRIARVRGRDGLARLDAAWTVHRLSDASAPPQPADLSAQLAHVVAAARLDRAPADGERLGIEARTAVAAARRLIDRGHLQNDWSGIRAALDDLGDALATEALGEMAYAVSMGWAEDLPLTALAAFRRHVFVRPSVAGTADASWLMPDIVTARDSPWHVAGSLLGLGDALAPVALRRPSLKPLAAAPTLNTGDRRWLVTTIAAFDRRHFTDDAQRVLVAAIARGEARVATAVGASAAQDLAADAGAPPLRQVLAGWVAQQAPAALRSLFSMTDIVRLGIDGGAVPESLAGWGAAQRPLSGRMAAGDLPRWPWERFTGRSQRLVACALPDLQLVLAVRLAALELPAMLVVDLMPSATYELVNIAAPRHADDFAALAEHVRGVDQSALERHLGLLTTTGPLRPIMGTSR